MKVDYENLFEKILLRQNVPFLHIKERRRPMMKEKKVKVFDFIVLSRQGLYLIEVKGYGRYYPDTNVSVDDVEGLKTWENLFQQFTSRVTGLFVFMYKKGGEYTVKCLDVASYDAVKRSRAEYYHRGGTVAIPRALAPQLLKNLEEYIPEISI